ncbi:Universal stress protein UspA-related nucleotide-binding protein [Rubrobacter radiotolerans]|uniref:Universal stress protein n=1 Tax=Rubrobacter radiotolerans TaxID=42256 RepID=A0A023X0I2_RUBRA|nr:universal stress protein [Rubrobacter radiotolerans]AHY45982.1 Universal stress protein UspA-related nucleotide-binding protein [Rubrobacter radiotolerans]MDX5893394.1 universal stress protein [Rubrobacter radiotolerans]SMC03649.1 Nucleotide-binding universal stress protein, UspA family [Rubrobacter radiotolerans DSM 5868]
MSIFPTRILLATDGSEDARLANETAVDLAKSTNSELHVITVGGGQPDPAYYLETAVTYEQAYEAIKREAQDILDKQLKHIEELGGEVAGSYVRQGDRAREIVRLSEELDAGLIVLGSRGLGGLKRAFMGSVSDSVVRHAHCPVMVVRR